MADAVAAGAAAAPTGTQDGRISISVPEDVVAEFKQMKQKRKYKWMLFALDQETFTMKVASTGGPKDTPAQFVKALPLTEARYAVFDSEFQNKYGGTQNRIYVFLWTPANAGRANLFYASQRGSLDSFFSGTEGKQATTKAAIEAVLLPKTKDDEGEWDPDA